MEKVYLKEINGNLFKKKGNIFLLHKEGPSSRKNSWVTMSQIAIEYPEFIDKIADILYYKEYDNKAKDFARNVLNFLHLWKFVSWKQFDSILSVCSSYESYKRKFESGTGTFLNGRLATYRRGSHSFTTIKLPSPPFTDREFDRLHEKLFGQAPYFEEEIEDGMEVAYRSDGSRYFMLPTGDLSLHDFI